MQWDSETIRALRAHLRVSQSVFARYLGVRQQTVSEWETGMYRPRGASGTLLSMIAERAGFSGDEAPPEADGLVTALNGNGSPVDHGSAPSHTGNNGSDSEPESLDGDGEASKAERDPRGYTPYIPPARRRYSTRGNGASRNSEIPF
ncbi:MAG: helix-turn-helix domain-containing protein [Chloroflexota bacterium]